MANKRVGIIRYRDEKGNFIGSECPIGNCAAPSEEDYDEVDRALAWFFARELKAEIEAGTFTA